jgi:hypothetical protein
MLLLPPRLLPLPSQVLASDTARSSLLLEEASLLIQFDEQDALSLSPSLSLSQEAPAYDEDDDGDDETDNKTGLPCAPSGLSTLPPAPPPSTSQMKGKGKGNGKGKSAMKSIGSNRSANRSATHTQAWTEEEWLTNIQRFSSLGAMLEACGADACESKVSEASVSEALVSEVLVSVMRQQYSRAAAAVGGIN